jgi:drug/metabolite transporter (DMT)-like permease
VDEATSRRGLILILTPLLWGATFPAAKVALRTLPILPFTAWTRLLGFLTILVAVPLVARRELTIKAIRAVAAPGLLLGGLIFIAYLLQTAGLERTTSTNAGFITGLYVVFTPLLALLVLREPARRIAWLAVAVSLVGLAFLSIARGGEVRLRMGDLLVLASAAVWAAHLVAVGYFVTRHPARLLSLAQMAATAAFHLVAVSGQGLRLGDALDVWHLLVLTGILGSGLAYTLQVVAQRELSATRAAIILAGESVAAAVFSAIWLGERLTASQWMGAALIVGAMVTSEMGARRRAAVRLDPGTAL